MPQPIPDLWQLVEDAQRLYTLFLLRLQQHGLHERVASACRQIREHAAAGPGPIEGVFAFNYEIESLSHMKRYREAWKQLKLRSILFFGRPLDLDQPFWPMSMLYELDGFYFPLLYFLERYEQGCALNEKTRDPWFQGKNAGRSYSLLLHVYNEDPEPECLPRVTLSHFYRKLSKPLSEWRHWEAFVNGFHPKLFRLAGTSRDELLADSDLLADFTTRLLDLRDSRTTSGVGGSQSDLIQSAGVVARRQEDFARRIADFQERHQTISQQFDQKLKSLFPELRTHM